MFAARTTKRMELFSRKIVGRLGESPFLRGSADLVLTKTLTVPPYLPLLYYLCLICLSCCSVAQSCPALCDHMDDSTPGFPVLHLPELAQTHVH